MLETGKSSYLGREGLAETWKLELTVGRHCAHSSRAHPRGRPVRCKQSKLQDRLFLAHV